MWNCVRLCNFHEIKLPVNDTLYPIFVKHGVITWGDHYRVLPILVCTHTQTHTHAYIFIYIYMCIYLPIILSPNSPCHLLICAVMFHKRSLGCHNRQDFTKWLPPWRMGRITCLWVKSVFDCLTIGIIHETMVVHMTWVWTFFNNYSNHLRMCVLSTLCGNDDKHSPFDIYIYICVCIYMCVCVCVCLCVCIYILQSCTKQSIYLWFTVVRVNSIISFSEFVWRMYWYSLGLFYPLQIKHIGSPVPMRYWRRRLTVACTNHSHQ